MRSLIESRAEATADLVHRVCPRHPVESAESRQDSELGQVLVILTDYDDVLEDLHTWCAKPGQEFIGICGGEDEDHDKL